MKTMLILLFTLLSATFLFGNTIQKNETEELSKEVLILKSSTDLLPVTSQWANEFNATNPARRITILPFDKGVQSADDMDGSTTLGFMLGDELAEASTQPTWKMVVGRDVVVPVINSDHPYYEEIHRRGISMSQLQQLFSNKENKTWELILGQGYDAPVHILIKEDKYIASALAAYLDVEQDLIVGGLVKNNETFVNNLQNDVYAIGFCRLSDVETNTHEALLEKVSILPLDVNGNGKLDYMEDIYSDLTLFSRGVWIGKYPKALFQNIYTVSYSLPQNEEDIEFIKWLLTSGQNSLVANAYVGLVANEIPSKLSKLNDLVVPPHTPVNHRSVFMIILVILAGVLGLVVVVELLMGKFNKRQVQGISSHAVAPVILDVDALQIPKGVYFDKSHTWVFMEKKGTVQVGIDDFLQHLTGPFSRVIMKNVGDVVKKGEAIITVIQYGKQLTLYAPISGTIKAFNSQLIRYANAISASPYESGWMYIVEPTNWLREKEFLNASSKYKEWMRSELIRFKDFIASCTSRHHLEPMPIVLQDGGEIVEHVLSYLGPEIWDDFQTNFLDSAQ